MATDFFLKLDGVKGESTDAKHAEEINVQSFSWGESNSTSIGSATGGAGAGKAKFDSAVFTVLTSKASPVLAQMCASGAHIPTAVLTVRKAGGKQEDYYKVTFKTVFLTQFKSVGGAGTDVIPREEFSFVFGEYVFEYLTQAKDGSLTSPVLGGWNQVTNKKA